MKDSRPIDRFSAQWQAVAASEGKACEKDPVRGAIQKAFSRHLNQYRRFSMHGIAFVSY
jgi:hypothetical protein